MQKTYSIEMFTIEITHIQKKNMEQDSQYFFTQIVIGLHYTNTIYIAYSRLG